MNKRSAMMCAVAVMMVGVGLATNTGCALADPCPGQQQCGQGCIDPSAVCCGSSGNYCPAGDVCGPGGTTCLVGGGGGGTCPGNDQVCNGGCVPFPSDCCSNGSYCFEQRCGSDATCQPINSTDCGNGKYCPNFGTCINGGTACS